MLKYEIAIAVKDAQEFGNPRKKEGDLVAVIPHGAQWGSGVIAPYFIVIVETLASFETIRKMCAQRLYQHKQLGMLTTADDYERITVPIEDGGEGGDPQNYEIKYKNRYSIPFNNIKIAISDLNMTKLQDENYIYQPFKTASKLIEGFDGKNGHNLLDIKDMDTTCLVAGIEQELSISLDVMPIIWDKYTQSFVKPSVTKEI